MSLLLAIEDINFMIQEFGYCQDVLDYLLTGDNNYYILNNMDELVIPKNILQLLESNASLRKIQK